MKLKEQKFKVDVFEYMKYVGVFRRGYDNQLSVARFYWGNYGLTKTQALILANFLCDQWNEKHQPK